MERINFTNLPSTDIPFNATTFNLMQDNIEAEIGTKIDIANITTGTEFKTGRIIDGKEEYGKRIDLGTMPNATTKNVTTGLSNITLTRPIEGVMTAPNQVLNLPLVNYGVSSNTAVNVYLADVSGNALGVRTNYDWSAATGFVTLYYTKNS